MSGQSAISLANSKIVMLSFSLAGPDAIPKFDGTTVMHQVWRALVEDLAAMNAIHWVLQEKADNDAHYIDAERQSIDTQFTSAVKISLS